MCKWSFYPPPVNNGFIVNIGYFGSFGHFGSFKQYHPNNSKKTKKTNIYTPPLITKRYYQLDLYKGIYEAQHVAS